MVRVSLLHGCKNSFQFLIYSNPQAAVSIQEVEWLENVSGTQRVCFIWRGLQWARRLRPLAKLSPANLPTFRYLGKKRKRGNILSGVGPETASTAARRGANR